MLSVLLDIQGRDGLHHQAAGHTIMYSCNYTMEEINVLSPFRPGDHKIVPVIRLMTEISNESDLRSCTPTYTVLFQEPLPPTKTVYVPGSTLIEGHSVHI